MEYSINGIVIFTSTSRTKLLSTINYHSPSNAEVEFGSKTERELSVLIQLSAEDDDSAEELAHAELRRISNMFSFNYGIPVSNYQLKDMYCKIGHANVIRRAFVESSQYAVVIPTLSDIWPHKLIACLEKGNPFNSEDALTLWREATNKESSIEKYLLLYRLMEYIFVKAKSIDDWIKSKDPSVKMIPPNNFRKWEHTVYTYLRDNIHYKQDVKRFPVKEVVNNLSNFQSLVQQAVKEKFCI
jgi:hypothetical protein